MLLLVQNVILFDGEETMQDYLTLGPVPYDEPCAQVGSDDYRTRARRECVAYAGMLVRMLGAKYTHTSVVVRVKNFPHDFGSYLEVAALFSNDEGAEQAYWLDENLPAHWDEEALSQLVARN